MSWAELRSWERGAVEPPLAARIAMAEVYGVPRTILVPERPLAPRTNLDAGTITIGSVTFRPADSDDETLREFLHAVRTERRLAPGDSLAVRACDAAMLADLLGGTQAAISARIAELLDTSSEDARDFAAWLWRRRVVMGAVALGVTAGLVSPAIGSVASASQTDAAVAGLAGDSHPSTEVLSATTAPSPEAGDIDETGSAGSYSAAGADLSGFLDGDGDSGDESGGDADLDDGGVDSGDGSGDDSSGDVSGEEPVGEDIGNGDVSGDGSGEDDESGDEDGADDAGVDSDDGSGDDADFDDGGVDSHGDAADESGDGSGGEDDDAEQHDDSDDGSGDDDDTGAEDDAADDDGDATRGGRGRGRGAQQGSSHASDQGRAHADDHSVVAD